MTWPVSLAACALVALLAAVMGESSLTLARTHSPQERTRDLARQEREIRRGQNVVRRLLRNPRVSPEIKQQATELQALLDARAQGMARLESVHKEFLAQHQADLQELQGLRKQAFEIDERLSAARKAILQAHEGDIAELTRSSQRAVELVEKLQAAQGQERRERHPR